MRHWRIGVLAPGVLLLGAVLWAKRDHYRPDPGYTLLLDGAGLKGWQAAHPGATTSTVGWKVRDGMLEGQAGASPLECSASLAGDFDLKLEFRGIEGGEGFISIGSSQIVLRDYRTAGPPAFAQAVRPPGDWNGLELKVRGSSAFLHVDGRRIDAGEVEADLSRYPPDIRADGKPVSGIIELVVAPAVEVALNGQIVEKAHRLRRPGALGLHVGKGMLQFRHVQARTVETRAE